MIYILSFFLVFICRNMVLAQEVSHIDPSQKILHAYFSITNPPVNSSFCPIDFPAGAKLCGLSLSGKASVQKVGEAGSISIENKKMDWQSRYKINSGCVLINSCAPALIDIGPSIVYVDKHATTVLHTANNTVRVANLADRRRNSVKIIFNKNYINLDPGHEIVFVHSAIPDPKLLVVQEGIGWRNMQHTEADGWHIFVFRVSTVDMLKTCRIYRQLNQSPLSVDHALRDDIVKTVAALEEMYNKRKGPFNIGDPYLYGTEGKPKLAKSKGNAV